MGSLAASSPKKILSHVGNQLVIFLFLRLRVWIKGYFLNRKLIRDAKNLEKVQNQVLLQILRSQKNTEYGKLHFFNEISCAAHYRKNVPINDYEDLRPWFEKQELENVPAINAEQPILYTLTSGTTGKPKLIPVLKRTVEANRKIQNLFLNYLFRARSKVADGKILTIVSPAVEGYTENANTPFGATTGHMYASAPKVVQKKYVVPPSVFTVEDYDTRFLLILSLALQEDNITYITTANPSTLVRLIQLLNTQWHVLLAILSTGKFPHLDQLQPEIQKIISKKIKANPERAIALENIRSMKKNLPLQFRDIWKNIQAVGVWTGGSCAIFHEQLKDEFSTETLIRDVGYHSSEFRGSTPIFSHTSAGIPTFRNHYFEFIERNAWDRGEKNFLGLHQLEDKKEYQIFVTTEAGLYRYNMNDIVKVDGYFYEVPLLRFMQKGKGVTSITGEKLYENQVISSVKKIEEKYNMKSAFYMMVADAHKSQYTLYYEIQSKSVNAFIENYQAIVYDIDSFLGEVNIEYTVKRNSGRLHPVDIIPLAEGSYELYKRFCIDKGQRESQFKIIALYNKSDLDFNFAALALELPASITQKKSERNITKSISREAAQVS